MFWVSDFDFVIGKLKVLVGVAGRQRTPLSDIILVRYDREGERADSPCFPAPTANFSRADLFDVCFGFRPQFWMQALEGSKGDPGALKSTSLRLHSGELRHFTCHLNPQHRLYRSQASYLGFLNQK